MILVKGCSSHLGAKRRLPRVSTPPPFSQRVAARVKLRNKLDDKHSCQAYKDTNGPNKMIAAMRLNWPKVPRRATALPCGPFRNSNSTSFISA